MLSHYHLVEKIGEGGMGVVYRAEDTTLKRPVALKFLTEESLSREDRRARFLREARLAAALNHPSICTVYAVGEVQPGEAQDLPSGEKLKPGTPFIVMELIEGDTLERVLAASGALPLEDLLRIAVRVAEGLAAAHARAVVHRDLKPGNVMISRDGRAKILDFGLAKPLVPADSDDKAMQAVDQISTELSHEGMVVGTTAYMSPEQAQGDPLDSRSDIFSFGTMLYEMVTGKRPFGGRTRTSTLARLLEAEPVPVSEAREDVPQELERIIRRCLRKNPEERYNDTRDMVVELKDLRQEASSGGQRRLSSASGAEAFPPPRGAVSEAHAGTGRVWAKRWALVATGTGVAVLLTAVSLPFFFRTPGPPPLPVHRRLTFTGSALHGAISPDGRSIAYVQEHPERGQDVLVQDLAGGQPLKVYEGLEWAGLLWSHDGSEILVHGERTPDDYGSSIVPRLGGASRHLPLVSVVPAWSPDGARLLLASAVTDELRFMDKATGTTSSIPLSGSFEFLYEMDWSMGRDLLLFLTEDDEGRHAIWTISPDGGNQQKVLEQPGVLLSPRWSADGDAIYYLVPGPNTSDLWKIPIDPDGGGAAAEGTPVLTGLETQGGLTLSRDGRRLLYTKLTYRSNLWLLDLRNTGKGGAVEAKPLTSGASNLNSPSLSPDGQHVVFTRDGNIHIMPVDGGPGRQITFLDHECSAPVWSPDGEWIAFGSSKEGGPKVWRVPAGGGPPRPFAGTQPSPIGGLAWAPGSRLLYLKPGNRNFSVLDPSSEEEAPLVEDESMGWMFNPQISPDGTRVAVFWNRGGSRDTGIWLISLEDGSGLPIHAGQTDPAGWSATGAWVYALDTERDPARILKIPAEGGDAQSIFEWAGEGDLSYCGGGGGRESLVCAVVRTSSDIWLVENFDPESR
jgi:Tol biopolymer transport system component/tRNA A-37 threonylcarbamoyl transferase component Bud32